MASFRVIIVGGSIAGLTLANILERYGIDYIVLEKHYDIAPQLGASLGLLPHGSRILDQLGINDKLKTHAVPVKYTIDFGPDGHQLKTAERFGDLMEDLLGYRMWFMDRQHMLRALYDNLQDKSKIHTSMEVLNIQELDNGVQVGMKDGCTIRGDILVGADGVHSRMRNEMWRLADMEEPDFGTARMKQSISCTYRCIFGIAKRPHETLDGAAYKAFFKGRSYLCPMGPDNKAYFFAFFKNPETKIHQDIPRYSEDEANELAAAYANDHVFNGYTFGDLYERRMSSVLVPIEEYVLEKASYKRAVLIGDSFHKMNPLTGQGGNAAIESAGFFCDLLKEALEESPCPDYDRIQRIFHEYEKERGSRSRKMMEDVKKVQRMEALDTPLQRWLQLNVVSKLGGLHIAPLLASGSTPGRTLRYLPKSTRPSGAVALNEQVQINAHDRSTTATVFWMGSMLFVALLSSLLSRGSGIGQDLDYGPGPLQVYKSFITIAISGFWVVESYRPGLLISPLFSSIPYLIASFALGWEVVLPVYFAIHIYMSGQHPFYYPSPRAINLWAAKALPLGILTIYIPIVAAGAAILGQNPRKKGSIGGEQMILAVHASLPLLLHFGKHFFQFGAKELSISQMLFGARDTRYISRFFNIMILVSSTSHLVIVSLFFPRSVSDIRSLTITPSVQLVQVGCLTLAVVMWCTFTIWDMRRVNLTKASPSLTFISTLLASFIIGPAAVLSALWKWREAVLEEGRQRK
ncbi:hypothetical protein N7523_007969 [Penicillium sp. IBT 18751x]|nr:hypothetical protein N7523_007969 [Penicillium sp. IBT 18751x]